MQLPFTAAEFMDDLLTEKGRQEAAAFWKLVHFRAENRIFEPVPAVSPKEMQDYVPSGIVKDKLPGKETVIAASLEEGDSELAAMKLAWKASVLGGIILIAIGIEIFVGSFLPL